MAVWDTKGRLEDMEQMFIKLRGEVASATDSKSALEESLSVYKSRGMTLHLSPYMKLDD